MKQVPSGGALSHCWQLEITRLTQEPRPGLSPHPNAGAGHGDGDGDDGDDG
jgi:hypothetical protein